MSLEVKINESLKVAMKAKDKTTLNALRSIKKEILEAKTAKGASGELSSDLEMKLLQKMVKQRNDSATIYNEQGRQDMASTELEEAEIIASFLPEQMSAEELETEIVKLIEDLGINSMAGMGRVMGAATTKFAGKADGKMISEIVKRKLSN